MKTATYSGFELFSSQPDKREFKKAPEETIFKFKLQDREKPRKMSYKLKQGTSLPYTTNIGGDSQRIAKYCMSYFIFNIQVQRFQLTSSWNSQFLGLPLKKLEVYGSGSQGWGGGE